MGEECDDCNMINGDACTNACQAPTCGDQVVEGGEECDDGNMAKNDGCHQCQEQLVHQVEVAEWEGYHTCAVLSDGAVRCWGNSTYGELGYGNTNDVGDDEHPWLAGNVNVGGPVVQIDLGGQFTCALLANGSVRCWGSGFGGQLGYGNTNHIGDNEVPANAGNVDVGGVVTQVASGANHNCALLVGGTVRCWGQNGAGQLGYGNAITIGDDEAPSSAGDVDVGGTVVQLACGGSHTCALLDTGAVRCWGSGGSGALGYGNQAAVGDNEVPADVGDVDVGGTVVELAAGYAQTCARLDTGFVHCWGEGIGGALGYGNTNSIGDNEPASAAGVVAIGGLAIDVSTGQTTCAVLDDGALRCWGRNNHGQAGYANTVVYGDTETPASVGVVNVGVPIAKISSGTGHTCALTVQGNVRCWGRNSSGQLGYSHTNTIGDTEHPVTAGNVVVF
jgi:cysteine-rich repeat protein